MIETEHLRRAYGSRAALHGLTLAVAPGEILGFLGPNGAGKSTTVKILTGDQAGRRARAGRRLRRRRVPPAGQTANRVHAGIRPLYETLSTREYLESISGMLPAPAES